MKYYALFYDANGHNPCGDRSIIQIDGRLTRYNALAIAHEEMTKRKFKSLRLVRANAIRHIPDSYFEGQPT